MWASVIVMALAAVPQNLDLLSAESHYDLDCFVSGGVAATQLDGDNANASTVMAFFYLGRLSTRYKKTKWIDVSKRELLQSPHDTTWWVKNAGECATAMIDYTG